MHAKDMRVDSLVMRELDSLIAHHGLHAPSLGDDEHREVIPEQHIRFVRQVAIDAELGGHLVERVVKGEEFRAHPAFRRRHVGSFRRLCGLCRAKGCKRRGTRGSGRKDQRVTAR